MIYDIEGFCTESLILDIYRMIHCMSLVVQYFNGRMRAAMEAKAVKSLSVTWPRPETVAIITI